MKRNSIIGAGCLLIAISLGSCKDQGPCFTIQGNIADAKGEKLYLELVGIEKPEVLDSVKLGSNGAFKFKQKQPEAPDYYRLRLGDQVINVTVDSTETITVKASKEGMATNYEVTGSEQSAVVKELALKQMTLQSNVDKLLRNDAKLAPQRVQDSLFSLIRDYKEDVKRNYIFKAPDSAYAYFALFQRLGSYLIFDPLNSREDIKCFQAVATSLNQHYPHALRSKNLYNIVMKGLRNMRAPQQRVLQIPEDKIKEATIIDIALKDLNGNTRRLTDLKGKVVLLDFTVYQNAVSPTRNLALRELYDKYAQSGLEIYQISLDADEHFWKTSADNLPWICVRDANGIYSNYLGLYNVTNLPSFFLINRGNELKVRGENVKDIEAEIKKLL